MNDDVENETMKYLGDVWTEKTHYVKGGFKSGIVVYMVTCHW